MANPRIHRLSLRDLPLGSVYRKIDGHRNGMVSMLILLCAWFLLSMDILMLVDFGSNIVSVP